jgi:hypothetical protein
MMVEIAQSNSLEVRMRWPNMEQQWEKVIEGFDLKSRALG